MSAVTRGIVLAGGSGSRLYPSTVATCKQLLPVWDKPLVYYPIATLMLCGVRELLLISGPDQLHQFRSLLGDGQPLGISITYAVQPAPRGIAEAVLIGESFIGTNPFALILGDNLFHGPIDLLRRQFSAFTDSTIFLYQVNDPSRYGVAQFASDGTVVEIVEKPKEPNSSWAVTGLYLYAPDAPKRARQLSPSKRGELEITDLSRSYLLDGRLRSVKLDRGMVWLDTGTVESMQQASDYVGVLEKRQGLKIACLEEIALQMGFIDKQQLQRVVATMPPSSYRSYVEGLLV